MKKSLSSTFLSFFVNNTFELESYCCMCEKDIENIEPGMPPKTILKVCADSEKPIHFSYAEKDGLNQTGINGGIIIKNILGKLLALTGEQSDKYIRWIRKIGFLLPVSFEAYEAVDIKTLVAIMKRIQATVQIMNNIDKEDDYELLFNAITFLLYQKKVELRLEQCKYTTCQHSFSKFLNESVPFTDFRENNSRILENGNFWVTDVVSPSGKAEVSSDRYNSIRLGRSGNVPGQFSNSNFAGA